MNGNTFAAKCYYDIGKGPIIGVSKEENIKNLKDEVLRQYIAKQSASRFMATAKSNNVSVYSESDLFPIDINSMSMNRECVLTRILSDLYVEEALILQVSKGANKGQSWIVDTLYDDADLAMCKFSGTDEAGHNPEDLVGRTCDAWAHYSFFDSDETLVFVDIQGASLYSQCHPSG